jgi:hypothetical protein
LSFLELFEAIGAAVSRRWYTAHIFSDGRERNVRLHFMLEDASLISAEIERGGCGADTWEEANEVALADLQEMLHANIDDLIEDDFESD